MSGYGETNQYNEFLEEIIAGGHLDQPALGITKLVIEKGKDALTPKQAFVFKRDVEDEFVTDECARGGCEIPWSEMYEANDNGGLCSYCAHMVAKDD